MFRLLYAFVAFALLFTNGASVGHAMCQHADAQAHVLALNSADEGESSAALAEEMAEKAGSKSGTMTDAPVSVMALLPASTPAAVRRGILGGPSWIAYTSWSPSDRSTAPPSRPPLN